MNRENIKKHIEPTKVLLSGACVGLLVGMGSMYYQHKNPNYEEELSKSKNFSIIRKALSTPNEYYFLGSMAMFLLGTVGIRGEITRDNTRNTMLKIVEIEGKIAEMHKSNDPVAKQELKNLTFEMSDLLCDLKENDYSAYIDYVRKLQKGDTSF